VILFAGCDDDDEIGTPKPRGYFRIEMPEKKYVQYDAECPFTMEIPAYSKLYHSAAPNALPCWRDLFFEKFRATIYLSYHQVENDSMLEQLINDNWKFFEAHEQMGGGLRDTAFLRENDRVFGSVVTLGGNAAAQVQFYLTDSTKNFLRGSLYFYSSPNRDSLLPVLDFLRKDIYHMAQTLKWKDVPLPVEKTKDYSDSLAVRRRR
jgi:gliding motility-associated lipoprotein GldD